VGGDAVAYVDPDHGDGWRDAIIGLAGNQDLRIAMATRGRRRAALFSWKRSARLYLDEILRLRAWPGSELFSQDQPRQGGPHREA
jgi:glycosyltransferase involved in cell wall biosynthesis